MNETKCVCTPTQRTQTARAANTAERWAGGHARRPQHARTCPARSATRRDLRLDRQRVPISADPDFYFSIFFSLAFFFSVSPTPAWWPGVLCGLRRLPAAMARAPQPTHPRRPLHVARRGPPARPRRARRSCAAAKNGAFMRWQWRSLELLRAPRAAIRARGRWRRCAEPRGRLRHAGASPPFAGCSAAEQFFVLLVRGEGACCMLLLLVGARVQLPPPVLAHAPPPLVALAVLSVH